MKRRLILLLISVIILICFTIFLSIYITNSHLTFEYIIFVLGLIAYTLYSVRILIKQFITYKLDKKEGLQEQVLIFCELKIPKNLSTKYVRPTTLMATFKYLDVYEFINLSGDLSKVELQKGKKYKVSFYKHSKIIVDIREAYRSER